jgi:anti-sigma factor RsiW
MHKCSDISRLISRSLDERLAWHQRLAIRIHILYCKACRHFAAQVRTLRLSTSQYSDRLGRTFEDRLSPEQRAQIERSLTQTPEDPRQP